MRKLLLFAGLAVTMSTAFAQKLEKLDDVAEKIKKEKYDEAKDKLDKVLAANPTHADALFYKAVVYHNMGKQKSDSTLSLQGLEAMKAYVKAEQAKPEGQRMLLSTLDGNKTLIEMYQLNITQGVEKLRSSSYAPALNNFENAIDAFQILKMANLVTTNFDTLVVYYAGASAQNLRNLDKAKKYYDLLIANKIVDTSYLGVYRYMIGINLDQKDTLQAKKYFDLTKERFPQYNNEWLTYEPIFFSKDKAQRLNEYESLVNSNPNNESLALDYAFELYNFRRSSEENEKDPALRQRTEKALKNILLKNPDQPNANLLISQLYWTDVYNHYSELDAIRGSTAAATTKKKEVNQKIDAVFESVYPYLSKTYEVLIKQNELKPQEKANFKIVINQLIEYHKRKKQNDKVIELEQKLKSL